MSQFLKFFLIMCWKKVPVHKQTESGLEIAFCYLLEFWRLIF